MNKIFLLLISLFFFSCSSDEEENNPTLPVLTTSNASNITLTGVTSGGNITTDGGTYITARGVVWNTLSNPTISLTTKTSDGTGIGSFTSSITNLTPGTTYYVRAYATNSDGTAYGNEISFTTGNLQLPVITTIGISNITQNTASSGGNITSDGGGAITARGVVWSTTQNPTIALSTKTTDGSGSGVFTSNITNLTPNTTYYVRAYATNSVGTAYGNDEIFTTLTPEAAMYPTGTVFCNNLVTAVADVTNPVTGKTWMDRNLGASQVATSSTDTAAYGDLYQWGRRADGHQCRNSATTTTLSSSNQPGHGSFILSPSNPHDWRSPQNTNLWQGINGVNNPCPSGYRLPTITELYSELASWSQNNSSGAFASPLKLTVAGFRDRSDGSLLLVGSDGGYWSSTVYTIDSQAISLNGPNISASIILSNRVVGRSIRCIKD